MVAGVVKDYALQDPLARLEMRLLRRRQTSPRVLQASSFFVASYRPGGFPLPSLLDLLDASQAARGIEAGP